MLGNKLPHSVSAYMLQESTFILLIWILFGANKPENMREEGQMLHIFYINVFTNDVYNKQLIM